MIASRRLVTVAAAILLGATLFPRSAWAQSATRATEAHVGGDCTGYCNSREPACAAEIRRCSAIAASHREELGRSLDQVEAARPGQLATALTAVSDVLNKWAQSRRAQEPPAYLGSAAPRTPLIQIGTPRTPPAGVQQAFDSAGQSALSQELDGLLTPPCTATVTFENVVKTDSTIKYSLKVRHDAPTAGHVTFKVALPTASGTKDVVQWSGDVPVGGTVEEHEIALPATDAGQVAICGRLDAVRASLERRKAEIVRKNELAASHITELERLREEVESNVDLAKWGQYLIAVKVTTDAAKDVLQLVEPRGQALTTAECLTVASTEFGLAVGNACQTDANTLVESCLQSALDAIVDFGLTALDCAKNKLASVFSLVKTYGESYHQFTTLEEGKMRSLELIDELQYAMRRYAGEHARLAAERSSIDTAVDAIDELCKARMSARPTASDVQCQQLSEPDLRLR